MYDADKIITCNYNSNDSTVDFIKNTINIKKDLYRKVKKSYYNSNEFNQKNSIKKLANSGKYKTDANNIKFIDLDIRKTIKKINNEILKHHNYIVNTTTIEGSLININSILLFNQWMVHEVISERRVKVSDSVINRQKKQYENKLPIESIFKKLLNTKTHSKKIKISKSDKKFINKIKYKYLNIIKKEIKNNWVMNNRNSYDLLIINRMLFNGKTDTLMLRKKFRAKFRENFDSINDKYKIALGENIMGKTGGWVTRFLDYSIDTIRKKSKTEKDFEDEFKKTFPEIYVIIQIASDSIE